jgi:hypothetical protein
MELDYLPTEVILTHPRQSLGSVQLDWIPQPGNYLDLEGQSYAVLERRHRYQLKAGATDCTKSLSMCSRLKDQSRKALSRAAG